MPHMREAIAAIGSCWLMFRLHDTILHTNPTESLHAFGGALAGWSSYCSDPSVADHHEVCRVSNCAEGECQQSNSPTLTMPLLTGLEGFQIVHMHFPSMFMQLLTGYGGYLH